MNLKAVFHIIGFLLILTGVLMLTSVGFSVYYSSDDIPALLITGFGTAAFGALLYFYTKNFDRADLRKREGYLIVTLGWVSMSLFGALPFVIHGAIPSYTDAFFETMSGFTTTGASILSDVESVPHGLLFWRSMTHWIGGMGIIVLSLAILPILGIGGMQLYAAEVAGPTKDKLQPRVQATARRLWAVYVLLTAVETLLLMFGGMNLFDALCHSFGTLASGGFSTKNTSVAYYNSPYIDYVIIFFMFLAGTNFALHYHALHGRINSYWKDEEFRFYLIFVLLVVTGAALYLVLHNGGGWEKSFRDVAFSVISVLSSTGFATADYEAWAPFFSAVFLVLLLFGACAGSTSGGVKMVRHYLLVKNSIYELKRLIHPNAVIPVRFNNKAVHPEILSKISAFVLLYLTIWSVGSIIMAFNGLELSSAFGSVAACLGNIGPGLGTTGPVANYGHVSVFGKWFLSFIMLLGRLELFSVLIILTPSFWKK